MAIIDNTKHGLKITAFSWIMLALIVTNSGYPCRAGNEDKLHEDYPPWYHNKKKTDYGYPILGQVIALRSLTKEQRTEFAASYKQTDQRMTYIQLELAALRAKRVPDQTPGAQTANGPIDAAIADLREKLANVRYEAWLSARARLSQDQQRELKQQALDSAKSPEASRLAGNGSAATPAASEAPVVEMQAPTTEQKSSRQGVNSYHW